MHEWIRYHYRSRHTFQQVSYSGKLLPKKKFEDICLSSHACVWTCQRLMTIITMFKIKMQFPLRQCMLALQPYWYNKMSCAHIKRLFCSYHTKVEEDFTLNNTTVLCNAQCIRYIVTESIHMVSILCAQVNAFFVII